MKYFRFMVMLLAAAALVFSACGGSSDSGSGEISYVWTKTVGGTGTDYGNSAAVDSSGNVYVTGSFQGTVDFNPGTDTDEHTSSGDYDIFVTTFN